MEKRKKKDQRRLAADIGNLLIYSLEVQETPLEFDDVYHVASLLLLSAGIKEVNFDRSEYDPTLGWCSAGDRFQSHQDILEQNLVDNLTRFFFIWSSCEAAINIFVPNHIDGVPRGKINRLCAYLKHQFEPRNVSLEYKNSLRELNTLAAADSHYADQLKLRNLASHIGISGYGISSIYSIRNSLAHGSLGVPISKEEKEEFLEVRLIECCSDLVLYTLQMTITAYFSKYLDDVSFDGEYVDFELMLKLFHLEFCVDELLEMQSGRIS
ncbi:MAG: hypothetical protein AAF431_02420 [Pseudomonadota bacterium]